MNLYNTISEKKINIMHSDFNDVECLENSLNDIKNDEEFVSGEEKSAQFK